MDSEMGESAKIGYQRRIRRRLLGATYKVVHGLLSKKMIERWTGINHILMNAEYKIIDNLWGKEIPEEREPEEIYPNQGWTEHSLMDTNLLDRILNEPLMIMGIGYEKNVLWTMKVPEDVTKMDDKNKTYWALKEHVRDSPDEYHLSERAKKIIEIARASEYEPVHLWSPSGDLDPQVVLIGDDHPDVNYMSRYGINDDRIEKFLSLSLDQNLFNTLLLEGDSQETPFDFDLGVRPYLRNLRHKFNGKVEILYDDSAILLKNIEFDDFALKTYQEMVEKLSNNPDTEYVQWVQKEMKIPGECPDRLIQAIQNAIRILRDMAGDLHNAREQKYFTPSIIEHAKKEKQVYQIIGLKHIFRPCKRPYIINTLKENGISYMSVMPLRVRY